MCAVGWCRGILRPPCGQCETNGSAGVNVAGCALEQCLPQAARCWVCPSPGRCGVTQDLTDLNLLLLFMALCCFSVPQLLSVSFKPQAASVAQPQCCPFHVKLLPEAPTCCFQPGGPSGLWACRRSEKRDEGA